MNTSQSQPEVLLVNVGMDIKTHLTKTLDQAGMSYSSYSRDWASDLKLSEMIPHRNEAPYGVIVIDTDGDANVVLPDSKNTSSPMIETLIRRPGFPPLVLLNSDDWEGEMACLFLRKSLHRYTSDLKHIPRQPAKWNALENPGDAILTVWQFSAHSKQENWGDTEASSKKEEKDLWARYNDNLNRKRLLVVFHPDDKTMNETKPAVDALYRQMEPWDFNSDCKYSEWPVTQQSTINESIVSSHFKEAKVAILLLSSNLMRVLKANNKLLLNSLEKIDKDALVRIVPLDLTRYNDRDTFLAGLGNNPSGETRPSLSENYAPEEIDRICALIIDAYNAS